MYSHALAWLFYLPLFCGNSPHIKMRTLALGYFYSTIKIKQDIVKKVFSVLMLAAALSGMAQEKKQKPEGGRPGKEAHVTPEDQTKQLASELKLDDKQQAKVKALYAEQEKKRAANKPEKGEKGEKPANGEKPNREEMEAKMETENADFDKKMKGILTAEQYKKWQESQKKGADGREKKARAKKES